MTPYEIIASIEAHEEGLLHRQRELTTLAWMTSNLVWAKKRPPLKKLLQDIGKSPEKREKADDDQLIEAAKRKGLNGPW